MVRELLSVAQLDRDLACKGAAMARCRISFEASIRGAGSTDVIEEVT